MRIRALITLVVVLFTSRIEAREPWHAMVPAPRASLPTVTIDLGYPGPYIPSQNAPITLRAAAGDLPFDGYIGFHFRVEEHRTYDTPVIASAVLRPHQQWTFTTFATVRVYGGVWGESTISRVVAPREIAIEWRDRTMRTAAVRKAGVPPWTLWTEGLSPLRVTAPAETFAAASTLGRTAYVARADELSDRAQWYAGFSDVVVPLEVWLDLPKRVREAIFGSGIHIVFFGLPRSNQQLDAIDQALLPVAFSSRPGSYEVPWPYREPRTMPVPTPFSWKAKHDAAVLGGAQSPYIARTTPAAWAADEAGVSFPLPAMRAVPIRLQIAEKQAGIPKLNRRVHTAWPRPGQIRRLLSAPALTLVLLLLSIAGWIVVRRKPRAAIAAALVIIGSVTLAARDWIRPAANVYHLDVFVPLSPGVLENDRVRRVYGPSPLPAAELDSEQARTSIAGADDRWENFEVRTSHTPLSMGMMKRGQDWDALTRWSVRRELGETAVIHIRSRERNKLVLDYESPSPINFVYAQWLCGDQLCFGETAVSMATHGSATLTHAHEVWPEYEVWGESLQYPDDPGTSLRNCASITCVTLVQRTRTNTRVLNWVEPLESHKPEPFLLGKAVRQQEDGSLSWMFALPLQKISANATAVISVSNHLEERSNRVWNRGALPEQPLNISWATGTTTLAPSGRDGLPFATRAYIVPAAVFQEILAHGGVARVTMTGDKPAGPPQFVSAWIEVWEKRP